MSGEQTNRWLRIFGVSLAMTFVQLNIGCDEPLPSYEPASTASTGASDAEQASGTGDDEQDSESTSEDNSIAPAAEFENELGDTPELGQQQQQQQHTQAELEACYQKQSGRCEEQLRAHAEYQAFMAWKRVILEQEDHKDKSHQELLDLFRQICDPTCYRREVQRLLNSYMSSCEAWLGELSSANKLCDYRGGFIRTPSSPPLPYARKQL